MDKGVVMSEMEVIRSIGREVLGVGVSGVFSDNWLWDRTKRLRRNVQQICRLPEFTERDVPVDRFCLGAATYFADAGVVYFVESGKFDKGVVLGEINPADLREFSTRVVKEKLGPLLSAARIEKINRIITESGNRDTDVIEAKILSDARNLDDMGLIGVFNELRRCVIQGKGVSEALKSWQRKIDYRYWQARLKDSFCFESVRRLAEQRFAATEGFMGRLGIENSAQDIDDIALESLEELTEISA